MDRSTGNVVADWLPLSVKIEAVEEVVNFKMLKRYQNHKKQHSEFESTTANKVKVINSYIFCQCNIPLFS